MSGVAALDRPGSPSHAATRFRGRGEYAIDDKGRLTLPAQMRKALVDGGNLVVLDGRAVVWDEPAYRTVVDRLRDQVDAGDLTGMQVDRFVSNTHAISPDAQGRVVLPPAVRIEAGLDRDVLVLGVGSRIELVPAGDSSLEASLGVDDEVAVAIDRIRV